MHYCVTRDKKKIPYVAMKNAYFVYVMISFVPSYPCSKKNGKNFFFFEDAYVEAVKILQLKRRAFLYANKSFGHEREITNVA